MAQEYLSFLCSFKVKRVRDTFSVSPARVAIVTLMEQNREDHRTDLERLAHSCLV